MLQASTVSWDEVSAGSGFTCVRRTGERPHCMGDNPWRALGRTSVPETSTLLPMDDPGFAPSDWVMGHGSQCLHSVTGEATCWAENDDGELGFGDTRRTGESLVAAPQLRVTAESLVFGPHASYAFVGGRNQVVGRNDAVEFGRLGLGAIGSIVVPATVCIERGPDHGRIGAPR